MWMANKTKALAVLAGSLLCLSAIGLAFWSKGVGAFLGRETSGAAPYLGAFGVIGFVCGFVMLLGFSTNEA